MEIKAQRNALETLKMLASQDRQSILIEGFSGSGKTYLAKQYANLLHIDDFVEVPAKVSNIRESIEECSKLNSKLILCIENLDEGVASSSYALLKFLEEPLPNVYIVVTCNSISSIPDTILSRVIHINIDPLTHSDLESYASSVSFERFHSSQSSVLWNCARSFSEIDEILSMSQDQLEYYESLKTMCNNSRDSVSTMVWNLSHYPSKEPSNVELAIRCVMFFANSLFISKCGLECIHDLEQSRVSEHAALSKFIFNIKYCE